jgi:uncharacterized protein YajQ (UPF0234 family)
MDRFNDLLTIIVDLKYSKFINKKSRICIYNNCNKQASFNYINNKLRLYCKNHKLNDMVDIKNKRCIKCNIKQALYNYKHEKITLYCNNCKLPDMVDVKNKRCIDCNIKRSCFNYKDKKYALYCNDCKFSDMIDIVSKKCIKCNIKRPCFNYKGELKRLYCNNCKLPDMINIKDKKCKLCDLIQSSKKYNYLCSGCYYYTNPNSVLTRNHKTKENQIISDLNKEFNNIIIQDKTILNGCSKRRPDGLIQLNDYNIIIEIDENQHSYYSCENKRLMEIFKDLGNSPLTIIRFNPDGYISKDNKKIKSPFGITKVDGKLKIINNNEYNIRLNKLIEIIKKNLNIIPDKEINTINLFYTN